MRKTLSLGGALLLLSVVLAACQSGPTELADGEYQFETSSALLGEPGPMATAVLSGDRLAITVDGIETTYLLGGEGDSYILCPPMGHGNPTLVEAPMTLAGVSLVHPAAFGDCFDPGPKWLTIVDIDSFDGGEHFPFTRWLVFCVEGCGHRLPSFMPSPHIPPDS